MRGKSIHDVCDILSGMIGTLTFLIIPGHTPRPMQSANINSVVSIIHYISILSEEISKSKFALLSYKIIFRYT